MEHVQTVEETTEALRQRKVAHVLEPSTVYYEIVQHNSAIFGYLGVKRGITGPI